MLMSPKSLGPWCYYLALKSDCFTSRAPIQRVLELMHKPRCELKSHKTVSTCWLQGWLNSAGSESQSSIWQLFCSIQALATVLFGHISLAGVDEAVRALSNGNIDSVSWGPPRQTIAQCITPLQAGWALPGTQLELTRLMASLLFPQSDISLGSWPSLLSLRLSSASWGLCPRQGYHLPSLRGHHTPSGKNGMSSRDVWWALFC